MLSETECEPGVKRVRQCCIGRFRRSNLRKNGSCDAQRKPICVRGTLVQRRLCCWADGLPENVARDRQNVLGDFLALGQMSSGRKRRSGLERNRSSIGGVVGLVVEGLCRRCFVFLDRVVERCATGCGCSRNQRLGKEERVGAPLCKIVDSRVLGELVCRLFYVRNDRSIRVPYWHHLGVGNTEHGYRTTIFRNDAHRVLLLALNASSRESRTVSVLSSKQTHDLIDNVT